MKSGDRSLAALSNLEHRNSMLDFK
jgi:hypothetical protein